MRQILRHVRAMFTAAESNGMVICMAKPSAVPLEQTPINLESSMVTKLRVLCGEEFIKIGERQLRNDWLESMRRAITLCERHDHQGDAQTLRDVLDFLQS